MSLGRTIGLPMNGAASNLALSAEAVGALGRELRHGGCDVIHVQEPNAPIVSWFATEAAQAPLVREGMSWRELRLRALHATPVQLAAVGHLGGRPWSSRYSSPGATTTPRRSAPRRGRA